MRISVIIPLYNKENHILRAVQSVLAQTFQDFELIIVDDGSTDNSCEVASTVQDGRIRIIRQENQGVSAARNLGVAKAKSEWVAFLDADDEWLPDFLAKVLNLRTMYPDERVFCTSYFFQNKDGKINPPKTAPLFTINHSFLIDDFLQILRIGLPFNSSSFTLTRKAFEKIGGFTVGIAYQEDVDLWIRLSFYYKIAFLNTPLAIYHQDSENRACDKYDSLIEESYVSKSLIKMMSDNKIPKRFKQSAIEYIAKYQIPLARHYLLQDESKKAKETLRTCSGTRLYHPTWLLTYFCSYLPFAMLHSYVNLKNELKGL